MRTAIFVSSSEITPEQLREFATCENGEWIVFEGEGRGNFADRNGNQVVLVLSKEELSVFDDVEIQEAISILGCSPRSAVVIGMSGSEHKYRLGRKIGAALEKRFPGYVDWGSIALDANDYD
jgi:hypothetical protein